MQIMDTRVLEGEVLPAGGWDPDVERAFDELRRGVDDAESGGTVYVRRIPLDDSGNPMGNSKGQSRLFDCPLGSQSLDDICARVKREYMRHGEVKMCIRVIATKSGERGVRFNQIFVLERANEPEKPAPGGNSEFATILAAMQRNSDAQAARMEAQFNRTLEIMTAMRSNVPAPQDPAVAAQGMMTSVVSMMAVLQKFMSGMGGGVTPASVDPMDQMLRMAERLPRLVAVLGGNKQDDGGGLGDVAKALAPAAAELFKALGNRQQIQQPVMVRRANAQRVQRPPVTPAQEVEAEVKATVQEATGITDTPVEEGVNVQNMDAMKKLIEGLIDIAQNDPGQDRVDEAAAEVMSNIPDEYDDEVVKLVSSQMGYKLKLSALDARTLVHAEWFEAFRKAILDGYTPTE